MEHGTLEKEIVRSAHEIGTATGYQDLYDSQLSFWLSVQSLMRFGDYDAVRKRMPYVSKDVANAVANSSVKNLKHLCSAEFSTIKPSIPDNTILNILSTNDRSGISSKMVLQLLVETTDAVTTPTL